MFIWKYFYFVLIIQRFDDSYFLSSSKDILLFWAIIVAIQRPSISYSSESIVFSLCSPLYTWYLVSAIYPIWDTLYIPCNFELMVICKTISPIISSHYRPSSILSCWDFHGAHLTFLVSPIPQSLICSITSF